MVKTVYLITFFASLLVLGTLLIKHKRMTTDVTLFSILVMIQCMGRYMIAESSDYQLAWIGNFFVYVGACYCPLMVVILLYRLCQPEKGKWIIKGLGAFSTLVFALSLTIGRSPLYYSRFEPIHTETYTYILKEYGPAHILYPLLLVLYFCTVLVFLIYAIRKYRNVSLKIIVSVAAFAMATILLYILEHSFDSPVSYMSLIYLSGLVLAMRYIGRITMYDMGTNIANCIEKAQENAYIEFDEQYRCVGYNPLVLKLFPEINSTWNVDDPPAVNDGFLYREVIQWMYHREKDDRKTIRLGDRYYEMFVHDIPYGNKSCVGYMLEFVDRTAENKYLGTVQHYNEDLQSEVKKQTTHISHIKDMLVLGMSSMVESRDNSTGGHIKRTSKVMQVFADHIKRNHPEFGFSDAFLSMLVKAAPMHDLGKIAVDDAVLRKQGRFTEEEFKKMQIHPAEGARIVREILTGVEDDAFVELAENVAHYHHEKWNGMGYPMKLKGEEIPKEARLMALADVFDALVSKRCYKDSYSYDKAFSIIEESLGSHFDPVYGRAFMECRPQLEQLYDDWAARSEA